MVQDFELIVGPVKYIKDVTVFLLVHNKVFSTWTTSLISVTERRNRYVLVWFGLFVIVVGVCVCVFCLFFFGLLCFWFGFVF